MEKSVYREWCKHCQDWKIMDLVTVIDNVKLTEVPPSEKQKYLVCSSCGTKATNYNLNELPQEKVLEQRNRYKNNRLNILNYVYGRINPLEELFSEPKIVIVEADAGLQNEEKQHHIKNEERQRKYLEEKNTLKGMYGWCRRNDICPCGSGKKFKKCHLNECEKHGISHK